MTALLVSTTAAAGSPQRSRPAAGYHNRCMHRFLPLLVGAAALARRRSLLFVTVAINFLIRDAKRPAVQFCQTLDRIGEQRLVLNL